MKCLQYTKLLHTTTLNKFIFNPSRNDDRVMPINRGACNLCDSAEQWTGIPTLDNQDFSIVVE